MVKCHIVILAKKKPSGYGLPDCCRLLLPTRSCSPPLQGIIRMLQMDAQACFSICLTMFGQKSGSVLRTIFWTKRPQTNVTTFAFYKFAGQHDLCRSNQSQLIISTTPMISPFTSKPLYDVLFERWDCSTGGLNPLSALSNDILPRYWHQPIQSHITFWQRFGKY